MSTSPRFEVEPRVVWRHPDGRTVSIFGASPGGAFELVTKGFSVRDHRTNTVGMGRAPFATREAANAYVDSMNRREVFQREAFELSRRADALAEGYERDALSSAALQLYREADATARTGRTLAEALDAKAAAV